MSVTENLEQMGEPDFSPERAMRLAEEVLGSASARRPWRPRTLVVLSPVDQQPPTEQQLATEFIGPRIPNPIVLGEN